MSDFVKQCPRCGSERPISEAMCQNEFEGSLCSWSLTDEPVRVRGQGEQPQETGQTVSLVCPNGHPVEPGDLLCPQCSAAVGEPPELPTAVPEEAARPTEIDGWQVVSALPQQTGPWDRYLVQSATAAQALMTLYAHEAEPDQTVYAVLRKMDKDHIPELLATGRFTDRAYEVTELIMGDSLADAGYFAAESPEAFGRIADEVGRALASFSTLSLRHRDLNPRTILIRAREPLDLVITGFGSARLSDFDLESVAPLEVTRYSSPEAIVGGVSAASDWWGLGVILLEQATRGDCFAGVNDKAFQIHVVTRGIAVPENLDASVRLLLRGLLARDPLRRWQWPQVRRWLAGETVEAPESEVLRNEPDGPFIAIGDTRYYRPEAYALASAEAKNWQMACANFSTGALATWLEERKSDPTMIAAVRRLASDEDLNEDCRHALALMALNTALPLSLRGEIVTPHWLLAHPTDAYEMVTGALARHLERMGRERWLVRLRARAEAVRARARVLEIDLDEERLRVMLLASSRSNLEAERATLRNLYPDSNHGGVASLIENDRLSDEELIILVSAKHDQFTPIDALIDSTLELARQFSIEGFDEAAARALFVRPRREVYGEVDTRIAGFATCSVNKINEWAESFRVERRMPLPRAALVLTVPREQWKEPPKQQYIANLLQHFEKRVIRSVQRGPLVRFTIGKTTARVDMTELGSILQPAPAMLDHLLRRTAVAVSVDPGAFAGNEPLQTRFRRLVSHASTFKRDTAIDGRYLAFPFLLVRDARLVSSSAKIRIAPILLWPVTFDLTSGASGVASIGFDQDREEVRLSPGLEGLLGEEEVKKWQGLKDDLLARSAIKLGDVVDAFGEFAPPLARTLASLPHKDFKLTNQPRAIACAAAIFNAEFTGQSIAEDLRQLARRPPKDTALESALRVGPEKPQTAPAIRLQPHEQFATIEFDPSQEAAVAKARQAPGLLVEGPPGTGKSQTIVNIVSDCIGRGETALVVCQKQAALRVVLKRLEAEGLRDRIFAVFDAAKDREPILRALRDQLSVVQAARSGELTTLRRAREAVAARVVALETEINRQHQSLHQVDEITGLSYRSILSELIALEQSRSSIDVPALRTHFTSLGRDALSALEETCAPIAPLWLRSKFEGSPLSVTRPFPADEPLVREVSRVLADFAAAEANRNTVLTTRVSSFEINDPEPYRSWLDQYATHFLNMPAAVRQSASRWFDVFKGRNGARAPGPELIDQMRKVHGRLGDISRTRIDGPYLPEAFRLADDNLALWASVSASALGGEGFLATFNLRRWLDRRRCKKRLVEIGENATRENLATLRDAFAIEVSLRPLRKTVQVVRSTLSIVEPDSKLMLASEVKAEAGELLARLEPVFAAVVAALAAPCADAAEGMVRSNQVDAFQRLQENIEAAIARHTAREESRAALAAMAPWLSEAWIRERQSDIAAGRSTLRAVEQLTAALPTLVAYQRFRARASELPSAAMAVFAALRAQANLLEALPEEELDAAVRNTLGREARLAWAARLATANPSLTMQGAELRRKIESLAQADKELRDHNRRLLARGIDASAIGTNGQWDGITRLRGPRKRQLREIVDQGGDLGLFRLRPIWLMTPDLVSRVLPLRPAQHDVVIFDEASQLLVEHAVPALFRAKRVVISGDEKQMPPTSFFSSRLGSDEDEEFDGELDDAATDTERDVYEETWNRREIKDCPDLLALGHSFLPIAALQIHYRSKYRELIAFSNAAFYKGALSVPAHHPDKEIIRVRPIEVIRADGLYDAQTNPAEARRVVDVLAEFWQAPPEACPSVGVVTFNIKQADLVEDEIEKRAARDPAFLRAYQRERDRVQNGEDMGFFVKNVENVQGDERDVIVFSTTFGPNHLGAFRRNFGALGQVGGERRLNVAITRARQKVVIITSMPINDISDALATGRPPAKPRDYLQSYLDFASKVSAGDLESARQVAARAVNGHANGSNERGDDGIVSAVSRYLRELGRQPTRHGDDDAFAVDLAVEDPATGHFGLAIECDAPQDREGRLETARAREIWRPSVLRRAIPVVHRVSSQAWYFDAAAEKARLRGAVEAAFQRKDA